MTPVAVSIVVPVRNEAESVGALEREIAAVMRDLGATWELIFIDDGSTDATFEHLRNLHTERPEVRAIRFARNFGKSAALAAGFAAARGSIVITLDGDLQDDPREIPHFLAALDQGFDLVSGWKRRRRDPMGKRISSFVFNSVISGVTGLRLHDMNCGFKAYRAQVTRDLSLRHGLHRFIPLLAQARGYRVGEIAVAHRARVHGRSKYGWGRIPEALVDVHIAWLVARESDHPLAVFGTIGAALLVPGGVLVAVALDIQTGARSLLLGVGVLLALAGAHFVIMAALTRRAIAREPDGAVYSIAERLG